VTKERCSVDSPKLKSKPIMINKIQQLHSACFVLGFILSPLHILTHLTLPRIYLTERKLRH
jgi:hypothetical protein